MHDRTFSGRAAGRAKRLKVRSVSVGEMTPAQMARVSAVRPTLDETLVRISEEHLSHAVLPAPADSPWCCLKVWFGREMAVQETLDNHNIECLVPMRKGRERRVRHRVIPARMEPAITGYVFARFTITAEALSGMRAVEWVRGVLGEDGKPWCISHEKVMQYKALADDGGLDWENVGHVVYRQGEVVLVTEGPFGGFRGEVISARRDGRGDAVVEVDMCGRKVPVTLPVAILKKV